jgi:hypothetical protein
MNDRGRSTKCAFLLWLVFGAACGAGSVQPTSSGPAPTLGTSPRSAARRFAALIALLGDWEATASDGRKAYASYRLWSSNSVLVESFRSASGKRTLTLFHLDGEQLIATHYCARGNQPRLRLQPSSSVRRFELSFFDATNLPNPGAAHLRHLEIELTDSGHFSKTEEYVENGRPDVTVLNFTRAARRLDWSD